MADNSWKTKWSERDRSDLAALAKAEREVRETEKLWQTKINEVQADAKNQAEILAADAADLSNTVDELRQSLKLSKSTGATAEARIAELRRTAATSDIVQAELCSWSIDTAKELAAIADRNRAAGLACQAAYKAIK